MANPVIKLNIPPEVSRVTQTLREAGFEAYPVGGCIRDCLINRQPKDWDVTTNATPEKMIELFPKTFYENKYGTVTVVNEETGDEAVRHIEITPFRLESSYSDHRHPDAVSFSQNLSDDLKRRDFTINALAYNDQTGELVDLFGGVLDLQNKVIRAVGEAEERFEEDALRIMRAVRFAVELGFTLNTDTAKACKNKAGLLKEIAAERVKDEFSKMIMSPNPERGMELMKELGIIELLFPELAAGFHMKQNGDHIYDVWTHTIKVLQHSADREWPLHVRLSALLHDIGKPPTRRFDNTKKDYTFYGHDVVGARIAKKMLERLKFPNKTIEIVDKLVRNHMFFTDIDKITLSAVRRIIRNVGQEYVWDLMKVRACDRIGMGRPVEEPYRLRKYESMIEEALRAPTSVAMLKIDGARVIEVTRETPGPKIGFILHALLEEVLENPDLNTEEYLENKAIELAKLPIEELKALGEAGKEAKEAVEEGEKAKIRQKYKVK